MNRPMISGLLFLISMSTALGPVKFRYAEYEDDTRFPFFLVLLFNFIGLFQVFGKKRNPIEKGRGVPTNLWGWRTESELRKHRSLISKFSLKLNIIRNFSFRKICQNFVDFSTNR